MIAFNKLSSKKIVILLVIGISLSLVVSLLVSFRFSEVIGNEIQSRDLEFLFGAVESGPLELSRLQSSAIAQQSLHRIMSNPKFQERGIYAIEITGGEDKSFIFANWKDKIEPLNNCDKKFSRDYLFKDSINSYQITIIRNDCFSIKERKLIFWFSSLASLVIAIASIVLVIYAIWPVAVSVRKASQVLSGNTELIEKIHFLPIQNLVRLSLKSIELEKGKALADLASQVAHDIKSPVSVLNLTLGSLSLSEEASSLVRSSIQRINEISSTLMDKNRLYSSSQNSELVVPINSKPSTNLISLVEAIVASKVLEHGEYKNVKINFETLDENIYVAIESSTLTRILSNLINNAVEATSGEGRVKVTVSLSQNFGIISILDNGAGFPKEVLNNLGKKGFTLGKEKGNGLGLYHAKKSLQEVGGNIEVSSRIGEGSLVTVKIPT